MTKAHETALRATWAALPFLAAGLVASTLAFAQPSGDRYPDPFAPPPQARPWPQAQSRPELAAPRHVQVHEPEGPVTSWDPLRFEIAVELRTVWLFDEAAKRLAGGRQLSGQGASVQADVFRPDAKLAVRLDLGWDTWSASSFQSGTSAEEALDTNLFTLGVSLRYHVLRWLAPYARAAGGVGWDKVTVANLHDREHFEQASLGAGVFLRTPGLRLWQGSWAPQLGLVGKLEGGYTVATGSDFTLQASLPSSGSDPIPTSSVALGHVGRSAAYVRASLGLAF